MAGSAECIFFNNRKIAGFVYEARIEHWTNTCLRSSGILIDLFHKQKILINPRKYRGLLIVP